MSGRAPLLIPNIGAEEPGDREPAFGDLDGIPRVAAELWRALFAAGAYFAGEPSSAPHTGWPAALGPIRARGRWLYESR